MAHRGASSIHLVGFGSQARAWAQCLRTSGWDVRVYLSRAEGSSFETAIQLGFTPELVSDLRTNLERDFKPTPEQPSALIAMLCPDSVIGSIYADLIAPIEAPLTLILAHGYAMYAKELKLAKSEHQAALFAPKAIGPKIWTLFQESRPHPHRLMAGFHAPAGREMQLHALADGMGFAPKHRIDATFDQEAIGDLLSEQGLLCGGVFTLMEWTMEAMAAAGVPAGLIHEECITELELIAGLLRERGPASTFSAISQAAQCGTVAMQERLNASNAREHFQKQLDTVLDRSFVETFQSEEWKPRADALRKRLERWQSKLKGSSS